MWTRPFLASALLVLPAAASGADLYGEAGAGWVTGVDGDRGAAWHVGVGALAPLTDAFSLGARVRVHVLPSLAVGGSGAGLMLLGAARLRLPIPGVDAWAGLGAGYGSVSACLRGDYCGGGGAAGDVELGLDVPLGTTVRLAVSTGLAAQTGLVNGVDTVLIPTISLGLGI